MSLKHEWIFLRCTSWRRVFYLTRRACANVQASFKRQKKSLRWSSLHVESIDSGRRGYGLTRGRALGLAKRNSTAW